jgi:lipopolysaccharide export system protein LptC
MMLLKRALSIGCVPVIVAGIYGYVAYNKHPLPNLLDAEALAKTSDSHIYDVRYRQYDNAGVLVHFMEAPLITHIPKNNTHQITTPHIVIIESNQEPWDIHAQHAVAIEGGKEITFSQDVRIQQKKPNIHTKTLLTTEELTYFSQQKKASTLRKVIITQGNNELSSKGLIADLTTNTVQLLSEARGHYVQNAR